MNYKKLWLEKEKYLHNVMEDHEEFLEELLHILEEDKSKEAIEKIQQELNDMEGWDK